MKASLLPACCFFFCAALAKSFWQRERQTNGPGDLSNFEFPEWTVTNFDGGCSPGGCLTFFEMSSPATHTGPGISARCEVRGDRPGWQACTPFFASNGSDAGRATDNNGVFAMPYDITEAFTVSVQHRYLSNITSYPRRFFNVTGNITVVYEGARLPLNTTMRGTSVTEVWWWMTPRSGPAKDDVAAQDCGHHGCGTVRRADGSLHR